VVFTATEWDTSEDKERVFQQFTRLVGGGFQIEQFPKTFYRKLSCMFGHIAHYNRDGFYDAQFSTPERRENFIRQALQHQCYGDPAFTYSDVERELQVWLLEHGHLERLKKETRDALEPKERQELARLKTKYERRTA